MAAAYQWGYRVAIITAGAVPLLLADSYGWNVSYAVMAVLMTVGIIGGARGAARAATHHPADRDGRHHTRARARDARVGRPPRASRLRGADARVGARCERRRFRERAQRYRRGGRSRRSARRVGIGRPGLRAVGAVVVGFGLIALVALPLPGVRTRPGVYLSSALVDPLRDFFSRYRSAAGSDPGAHLPLPHPRLRAEHHEPVLPRSRLHAD